MNTTYQLLKAQSQKFTNSVKDLISKDKLEDAVQKIKEFTEQFSTEFSDEEAISEASIKRVRNEYLSGLIEFEEYNRNRTRASHRLMNKLGQISEELDRLIAEEKQHRNVKLVAPETEDTGEKTGEAALEKIIGSKNNLLGIAFLEKALNASRSICRVVRPDNRMGTGFLVNGKYLFTNNHVLDSANTAANSHIEFNYELDEQGNQKIIKKYKLDISDFKTDKYLDFTRVKVADPHGDLKDWGELTINTQYIPIINEPVNIIQHPGGGYKKIALTANEVISNDYEHFLFYKTDTEPGSSGSPVLNKDWEVIAIHQAGELKSEGGMQINAQGDMASANRGIYFRDIMAKIVELSASMPDPLPVPPAATENAAEATVTSSSDTMSGTPVPTDSQSETTSSGGAKKIFIMYGKPDKDEATKLKMFLTLMERNGQIKLVDMHKFSAGAEKDQQILSNLQDSDIVLAVITINFMYTTLDWAEKAKGMKKTVVPILISKAPIEDTFLERLQPLPSNGKSVKEWSNPDDAYYDIATNLRNLILRK